ncbi:TldD/PmbA family protein [Butyricimonas virosa]|jgi:peptidase U62 modulator of DNA gyrase|uniref:TldD/PmbA family protein n=3 Tax=Butyricimonas virosa TaxID=544645 RepID=A0A415QNV6_9BACT|nr:metallopeptidase TldD-related protein [Butyricimonas virosa]MBS5625014.1 TldD/PmbA family protein [Porphyromonadaceae bacterium]MCI7163443.1 metallopeptidase TldD-related protein [Butyricimonas virosa]MCI7389787.1 metallopeptidase TldD-related protein [Butyricimonas virosa]MDY4904787.1 metallopeptidase TldD-related protein [Butyricimonas virosa]RGL89821.1 TldD/PmbA family protein [Butyricimonas virosa]
MRKTVLVIFSCFLSLLFVPKTYGQGQDKLLGLLKEELAQQMKELKGEEFPPYHMNYRVIDVTSSVVSASFGALMNSQQYRSRTLVPQIRLGDEKLDNFRFNQMGAAMSRYQGPSVARLPLDEENNEDAVRQAIWDEVNNRYKFAVDMYQKTKAESSVNVEEEDKAPYFSEAKVEKYYEAPLPAEKMTIDMDQWAARMKEISAVFKNQPGIMKGDAIMIYTVERRYFVNNEGTEVVQNLPYARIMVFGETKADDGMELPLNLSYFAYDPADLPANDKIIADAKEMVKTLEALRVAPVVDPYTGPALLSGPASGVFFHEIFGHRIEGQRMKSENDGQTFKKMVGQLVLPADMHVYDDPTLRKYAGEDLNGFYKYDDQGVKAERVDVVVNGKLNDFLMTRTPIDGHPRTNGHARASDGFDPVSRQSNLVIETSNPKTPEELRQLLIEEVKKQGKEYGYFFKEVTSGFTFTGKGATNSFNVTPLEVYKVFADGRPDQLVRGVDLIGTPLSMFSNIIYAGNDARVFTGMCGAESGSIPVTAISPTILVNKVETQRKAKSQDILPILPAPGTK